MFGHGISFGREVEEDARRGAGARAVFISGAAKFRWLDKQF
ncbi:hypothetical protein BF49_1862 [Bradyrhizobium sp.]|nr:hypothetical protein BF49_1862 [Bradyrhizobium sp.]